MVHYVRYGERSVHAGGGGRVRLLKLQVENFKRFVGSHMLEVDEQLVALVGPNEAGKSSLLSALERLGAHEPPHAADRTRLSTARCVVGGVYRLESDDEAAIAGVHDAHLVKLVTVTRHLGDDTAYWTLDQSPKRDLEPRRRCLEMLQSASDDPELLPGDDHGEQLSREIPEFDLVLELLASPDESLSSEQIEAVDRVAAELQSRALDLSNGADGVPRAVAVRMERVAQLHTERSDELRRLSAIERLPTPWTQIVDALTPRLPSTALFRPVDRVLESHYDLASVAAPDATPPALANLAKVAGLNLQVIQDLVATGQRPHVQKLIDDANGRIKERFLQSWRQAKVFPYFTLDQTLQVYVSTEGEDFSYPAERSDGLRWFLALYAFLLSRQQPELILLIDEAETHLHYDAQADLIDALMSQDIASKVIYTTHSVGCLPPDIGRGIRAVVPEDGKESSQIKNTYWWLAPGEDEKVGHIPLLFGMGASLLALTVPRYAVISEGPSDAILLPTLIKRALNLASLPYRVVPGLSEISGVHMPRLKSHAGDVVCLVDGDSGGRATARSLTKNGIPAMSVLSLQSIGSDAAIEDLVTADLFVETIDLETQTWGGTTPLRAADVPDFGRWAWLKKQYPAIERPLNKNRVAGRMADRIRLASQVADVIPDALVPAIGALHQSILAALGVPTVVDHETAGGEA